MRGVLAGVLIACVFAGSLQAQRKRATQPAEPEVPAEDTLEVMSAQDSAIFRARITAADKPFSDCKGQAFQTCASGELEARLNLDGTAYGVLFTRNFDGKSLYLWRITRGGGAGGGGGGGARGRGKRRG